MSFSLKGMRVWVAGDRGMVGSAVIRKLSGEDCEILAVDRGDLDLRRQADVEDWLARNRPDAVVLAAARVGGIRANSDFPADFIYDNLAIEANVIHGGALPPFRAGAGLPIPRSGGADGDDGAAGLCLKNARY